MSNTLDDLKEEYPQYRLLIEKMNREGKTFEEIEDHLTYLDEDD